MDFEQLTGSAQASLGGGKPMDAARSLRFASRSPDLATDEARLRRLLELWANVAGAVGDDRLQAACRDAASLQPRRLRAAGLAFVDGGLSEVAIPFLNHVLARDPGDEEAAAYLAICHRNDGAHGRAVDILLQHERLLKNDMFRVLLVQTALQSGRVELAREHHARMEEPLPRRFGWFGGRRARSEEARWSMDVHRGVLDRHALVQGHTSLDDDDLRGWQYVLTGSVLLHLSPFGFDEGMRGRYAFIQDSLEALRLGIDRARKVLDAWGERPTCILELPDYGSRVVARAMARLWSLSVRPWTPDADGLIAAYSLPDGAEPLLKEQPRQLLFLHASCWTAWEPVVGDLVTFQYQTNVAPWQERMIRDPQTGEVTRAPASEESEDAWAQRIAESAPSQLEDEVDSEAALLAFVERATRAEGTRRFWDPGPVMSSRFG